MQTDTITTQVPARMDRLPWARFHWRIVIGLGTVWILDGLEVTMVGSVASRLTEDGSGIELSAAQIGYAAAIYVLGACVGALGFGHLTDRFGRKKLFLLTLLVYIVATVATAFAFAPWFFYLARFITGSGIGGEYAAINSAIDEMIPARVRGRVDLIINGSYWLGAAAGALAAVLFLNESIFPKDLGWRFAFGIGAILGFAILLVRRHVPESPRWLFIHGQQDEAERIVDSIEKEVEQETGEQLPEPEGSLKIRQRKAIPFVEIAKTAFKLYPKRAVLGLALFVGQAFLYNAITFDLGTLLSGFFDIASGTVPLFIAVYALGNFFGPLLLGRLFDTVGRKPMIAGTYLGSAAISLPLAILFMTDSLNTWGFMALLSAVFFLASAGGSSAYLTVSEIFPMETRALAIAFFYAVGTGLGGITGPLVFGKLIDSGSSVNVGIGFLIGAAVMALGGIAELFFGVKAEGANLEDLAKPLTAQDADEEEEEGSEEDQEGKASAEATEHQLGAQQCREDAERLRAQAAEHRAAALEIEFAAEEGDQKAGDRLAVEQTLAEMTELRAQAHDERAVAHDEQDTGEASADDHERAAASSRADAAQLRARNYDEQAEALGAEYPEDHERHAALGEAASERARAREQRAQAEQCLADDGPAAVQQARSDMHRQWADMHEARAMVHVARAEGDAEAQSRAERVAAEAEQQALAAEELITAAEHRDAADALRGDTERTQAQLREAAEQERRAEELERRVRERTARRWEQERAGLRRFRPGPGPLPYGRLGTLDPQRAATSERELDQQIDILARALHEHGPTERQELARLVGARYWGPGRFGQALGAAVDEGRAQRLSRRTFGPAERE